MNAFAKKYFNIILIVGALLGFILPRPGDAAGLAILLVLGAIIFASSFKVSFSVAFFKLNLLTILGFYLVRFIVLPLVVYYMLLPFSEIYATMLMLLLLMPAGVTSPAFTNVFEGNVGLALALLMLSSALVPLVVPYLCGAVLGTSFEFDQWQMLTTLFLTVIVPYLLHLPVRRVKPIARWMSNHDAFISIFGIGAIFTLAIAEYKQVLIDNPNLVLPYFVVGMVAFAAMYLVGWWFWYGANREDRVALVFVSGASNVALGLVITFLYFPIEVGVFFVVGELVWVVVLVPVQRIMKSNTLAYAAHRAGG